MESKAVLVCRLCLHGRWIGGQRGAPLLILYHVGSRLNFPSLRRQSLLVLKYILGDYPEQFTYYGYANVSQNVALMLSAVVLWIAQSAQGEYDYNLTL